MTQPNPAQHAEYYRDLLELLSTPRPNGSRNLEWVLTELKNWLRDRSLPLHVEYFHLSPYFFECIGVWLILSRTLLALSVWLHWGWWTLVIALVGLVGGTLDVLLNRRIVTGVGSIQGENLIISLGDEQASREVYLTAHYDSKTEPLDHRKRMFFVRNLRTGIVLTIAAGLIGPIEALLGTVFPFWSAVVYVLGIILTLPLLLLALGLGLNLSVGRLFPPSTGAVDNGAACAVLLGLADLIYNDASRIPPDTCIRIVLFGGEEVNMQGSRAHVRNRTLDGPSVALNLEVVAQDGEYVFWQQDGSSLALVPTNRVVNQAVAEAVQQETGVHIRAEGPVNSDCGSFLFAGIPGTVLGTLDKQLRDTGFHSPKDNPDRIVRERLPEMVRILIRFLECIDVEAAVSEREPRFRESSERAAEVG